MKTPKTIRVLCVDDHSFLIEGLRARFELEGDIECVGALPDAEQLVPRVRELRPDIVLLDIEMPGPDSFESAADLKRHAPDVRTIILSAYVRDHYISAAMKAGAWGYFAKGDPARTIVEGIRKVAGGDMAFSPAVEERCQPATHHGSRVTEAPRSRLDLLTGREQEVLRLVGRGMTRSEIAKTLSRSPKTIDGHRESIMQKLDIHDRGELVRFAIREGLVEA
ncbi:MAG: response regulator transcription factor [Phycisphaerales bacterium]|nr:response regulator transcription factor [Phycisphaerales bacterium]NNM24763.1 response regulator transcription factor [Phycisphaerales bacterium]